MAADKKSSKRKGAEVTTKESKPIKKAKTAGGPKASSDTIVAAPKPQSKSSRKRAVNLFDAGEEEVAEPVPDVRVTKKIKQTRAKGGAGDADLEIMTTISKTTTPSSASIVTKTVTKQISRSGKSETIASKPSKDFEGFVSSEDEGNEDAANLLAGFETSSESGSDDEHGIPLDKLPKAPPASSKAVKAAEKRRAQQPSDESTGGGGTLYIGHIPHGFYEKQMHAYFSQFGTIKHLRLARNRKTGAPKHYAFIEFASADVADIVQRTMDKYLLFNHILHVRKMADAELHPQLWRGSGRRFKVVPWAAIQARALKAPRERGVWQRRVRREEERRAKRRAVLEAYGYEFEVPGVRAVEDVVARPEAVAAAELVDALVAQAVDSGEAMPQALVDVNTAANGGEALAAAAAAAAADDDDAGAVPADEVQLKKESRTRSKGKRNVSAPINKSEAAMSTSKKGKRGGSKSRISV